MPTMLIIHPITVVSHPVLPDLVAHTVALRGTPLPTVNGFLIHLDFVSLVHLKVQLPQHLLTPHIVILVLAELG